MRPVVCVSVCWTQLLNRSKIQNACRFCCGLGWVGPSNHVLCGARIPLGDGAIFRVVPPLKCIRLCKQQTLQQHGAADLSAGDSASRRKRGFDSPAAGVTSTGRCCLSSEFFDHLLHMYRRLTGTRRSLPGQKYK